MNLIPSSKKKMIRLEKVLSQHFNSHKHTFYLPKTEQPEDGNGGGASLEEKVVAHGSLKVIHDK